MASWRIYTPEETEAHRSYFRDNFGAEYTNEEADEAWRNLIGFFDHLLTVDRRLKARQDEEKDQGAP
jgi:hypothetical protein